MPMQRSSFTPRQYGPICSSENMNSPLSGKLQSPSISLFRNNAQMNHNHIQNAHVGSIDSPRNKELVEAAYQQPYYERSNFDFTPVSSLSNARGIYKNPNMNSIASISTNSRDSDTDTARSVGVPLAPLPVRRQFVNVTSPPPVIHGGFVKDRIGRKLVVSSPSGVRRPPSYNSVGKLVSSDELQSGYLSRKFVENEVHGNKCQSSIGVYPSKMYSPTVQKIRNGVVEQPGRNANEQALTVDDLRSIADRQLQSIKKQHRDIEVKNQRIVELTAKIKPLQTRQTDRSFHRVETLSPMYQMPDFVFPITDQELTHDQEVHLHKLRQFRGHAEQIRLSNESLATEMNALRNQIATKERELASCQRRAAELSRRLQVIHEWGQWLGLPSDSSRKHPENCPFFEVDQDVSRWRSALEEIASLDREIGSLKDHETLVSSISLDDKVVFSSVTPSVPSNLNSSLPRPLAIKILPEDFGRASIDQSPSNYRIPVPSPRSNRPNSAPANNIFSASTILTSTVRDVQPIAEIDIKSPGETNESVRLPQSIRPLGCDSPSASPSTRTKPPRYASGKVISETYCSPQRRDLIEKYKRFANEHLQDYSFPKNDVSKNITIYDTKSSDALADNIGVEVLMPEARRLTVELPINQSSLVIATNYIEKSPSSSSSSSSSSLEYIDLGNDSHKETTDNEEINAHLIVKESGSNSKTPDSDLNYSDSLNEEEMHDVSQVLVNADIEDNVETNDCEISSNEIFSQTETTSKKPILRRLPPGSETKLDVEQDEILQKRGVRFHPLALLLDAALEGDLALVKQAACEVSDVSEPNDEGITALHNAVCAGRLDVAEFLIVEAGADVNAGDTDGWTPLHCAASCGNVQLARLLVEHGAALHARTLSDHETSLEKCDQGDQDSECERYLAAEQELLGVADNGKVFALFPRGLESAGPGSPDAHIEIDELPISPNEILQIVDRSPPNESDWMLAKNSNSQEGLLPCSYISRFPIVRIPFASCPIMEVCVKELTESFNSPSILSVSSHVDTSSNMIERDSPQMVEFVDEFRPEMQTESLEESYDCTSEQETSVSDEANQVISILEPTSSSSTEIDTVTSSTPIEQIAAHFNGSLQHKEASLMKCG